MKKNYVIGIDIGTTTLKAVFFDAVKNEIATTLTEEVFQVKTEDPEWVEFCAYDWWEVIKRIFKKAFDSGIDPDQIAGICFGGWTVMAFMVDENGQPLNNPVHYNDLRHMSVVEKLQSLIGNQAVEKNGNYLSMYSGIAKQYWWKKYRPEIFNKAKYFVSDAAWVNWKLTGVWAWNRTEAGFYSQYNVHTREWDDEILEKVGFPKAMFPKLVDAWEVVGCVTKEAAAETGLAEGIPVFGGVDDASPVAITTSVVKDGQCYLSVGSGSNICANSSKVISHPTTITYPHCIPGLNMTVTVASSTGICFKWIRNAFGQAETAIAQITGEDPYTYLTAEAQMSKPGSSGIVFLPDLDGDYTPNNDSNARGVFVGMDSNTTKSDMIRATLEGVGYSLLSNIMLIREFSELDEIVLTGGIAKSIFWLQIISDITNCSISLPEETEGAPFGSAILAAIGCGLYKDYDDAIKKAVRIRKDVVTPNQENRKLYEALYEVYKDIYPQMKGIFSNLADIRENHLNK